MKKNRMALLGIMSFVMISIAQAGIPVWTFDPLTKTEVSVPSNATALVQYRVINQSSKPHTLIMSPIQGITQITTGTGICKGIFSLPKKGSSCILSLQVNGSRLTRPIMDGPVVCQQSTFTRECYRPSQDNILRITRGAPITNVIITVTGSPLTLTGNGVTGTLTITNTTLEVAATNITSNFTGTALDGNVTETGNTCTNVPPSSSCTLTYTPGNTVVPQTIFTIQGSNTNSVTAAIAIQSGSTLTAVNPNSGVAAGGTGVTLTGTGLTGATSVMFGGVSATSVNVVSSTTVTAVTPAHAVGIVDVAISTPAGGATLANSYTYVATTVGQSSGGGTIACLGGGLQNMIAATVDNSTALQWWPGTETSAQSDTDGASNTSTIVSCLTDGVPPSCPGGVNIDSYAAGICSTFEVDSQSNTPCEAGNACYNDWFLPAKDQLNCLYINRGVIGGFTNDLYWASTESTASPVNFAWFQDYGNGAGSDGDKGSDLRVRCVRAFTP